MTRILLPYPVEKILKVLRENGHEAYIVGGCVRDALLGREPKDWDVTTSALPGEVKKCFRRTLDTGIKHGTVTVMFGKEGFEVTTYRLDGEYEDGRHPRQVTFTPSLEEDLKRRDFTVNAMAYDPEKGIVDLFDGQEDLAAGILRAVGDPEERFTEDALRILRALRFSAQLDMEIEEETRRAMKKLAGRLSLISAERIREEMTKLITSGHPERMRDAAALGATAVVLPEWDAVIGLPQRNDFHCFTVDEHTLETMKHIRPEPALRWAMLLHDLGKARTHTVDEEKQVDHYYGHAAAGVEIAREVLQRLKFDNDTTGKVLTLVQYHDHPYAASPKTVRAMLSKVGEATYRDLLDVMRADTLGKRPLCHELYLEALRQEEALCDKILADGDCLTLKDLSVKGSDLMAAGLKGGPQMGRILQEMLEAVWEDPAENTRENLMNRFSERIACAILEQENKVLPGGKSI